MCFLPVFVGIEVEWEKKIGTLVGHMFFPLALQDFFVVCSVNVTVDEEKNKVCPNS